MRLRLSSRQSDLARIQAYRVAENLKKKHPNLAIEFLFRESLGDKNLTDPLWKMPEKGVFTEDFYNDLISEKTDFIVHSWKDLPTQGKPDTEIIATLPRADQRDLLLIKKTSLNKNRLNLLSSSPRRAHNIHKHLLELLPWSAEIEFKDVRGNIPTRLKKFIEADDRDGLIVAKAALDRLLLSPEAELFAMQEEVRAVLKKLKFMVLPLSINPTAAAQGAIAVEIKKNRSEEFKNLFRSINSEVDFKLVEIERKKLEAFGGGCHLKLGLSAIQKNGRSYLFNEGLTPQGEELSLIEDLDGDSGFPQFKEEELWPSSELSEFIERKKIDFKIPSDKNAFFIARTLEDISILKQAEVVWTAGVVSWKKLAQKGIWVSGCEDSWGFEEAPNLEHLQGLKLNWVGLTHDHELTESPLENIATYEVKIRPGYSLPAGKKCFYWKSASQFVYMWKAFPEIREAYHASGLGQTQNVILKFVKENNGDLKKVRSFYNEDQWRISCCLHPKNILKNQKN